MSKLLKILMLFSILSIFYSCNKDIDDDGIKDEDESKVSIIDGISAEEINVKTFVSQQQSVGADGVFEMTKSGFIAATNNDNSLIYMGFADESEVDNYTLDAKETALFLSMRVIPFIHMPENKKIIKSLKDIFYDFQEVKNLENKIISVISEYKVLNISKIQNELTTAGMKIIDELNLYRTSKVLKNSPTITDQYVNGVKIEKVKDFEDVYDETTETWNIYREFKSTLGGVIGVAVGDYNFETNTGNYDKNNVEFVAFLSPFNVGDFFDTFTTFEGLKQFYEDSQNIIESGFDPESSVLEAFNNQTWYAETTIANFEVKHPDKDGLMFVAPADHYKVQIAAYLYLTLDILFEILSAAEPTKDDIKVVIIDAIINSDSAFELHQLIEEKRWDEFYKLSKHVSEQIIEDLPEDFIKETFITLIKDDLLNIDGGDFFTSINAVVTGINLWGSLIENTVSFIVQDSWAVPVTFDRTLPPPIVKNPYPFNITLQNVSKSEFSWTVEDYDEKILFDFYIGTTESKMEENRVYRDYENTSIAESSFVLDLKPDTRYYWRVVSKSENGLTSKSPIWYFDNGNFSFENQSLVAYYPFDGNANDESGNGNNGEVKGGVFFTDGIKNESLNIGDNKVDFVNLPNAVLHGFDQFTVSFWGYLNSFHTSGPNGPANVYLSVANNSTDNEFQLASFLRNEEHLIGAIFNNGNNGARNLRSPLISSETNTWHYFTFIKNKNIGKWYVNGVYIDRADMDPKVLNARRVVLGQDLDCVNGCFEDYQSLNGKIDELRIYDRVLSDFEVYELYLK